MAHVDGSILPPAITMPIADKDLIFVHLNEVTGPTQDTHTRHKVRAHVMRDFQRKKHKSMKSNTPVRRSLTPHQKSNLVVVEISQLGALNGGEMIGEPEAPPEELTAAMRFPDPEVIGMLEPFNTLPISGSPRLQLLMHHCEFRTIIFI